jgi:uncharacterized protein YdaU (DUF1376 family)
MSVDIDSHALDCIGLSWEGRGALDAMLTETWRRGAPFPDDDEKIAHGIGMHLRTWRRIRPELEPLFELGDGNWRHHLIDRARAHAERHAKQVSSKQLNLNFAKSLKTSDLPRHKKDNPIEPPRGSLGRTAVRECAHAETPDTAPLCISRATKKRVGNPPQDPDRSRLDPQRRGHLLRSTEATMTTGSTDRPTASATIIALTDHGSSTGTKHGAVGSTAPATSNGPTTARPNTSAGTAKIETLRPKFTTAFSPCESGSALTPAEKTIAVSLGQLIDYFGEPPGWDGKFDIYFRALKKLSVELLPLAIERCIDQLKFFPQVAEIRGVDC